MLADLIETSLPPGLVTQTEIDEFWMAQALKLADYAQQQGEIPVGALITEQNQLVATGFNQSISLNDPTAHAEVMALRQAGLVLQNYRLPTTTLYVTLEPCFMCAGALIHARVGRLVYGANDAKTGALSGELNLFEQVKHNHQVLVTSGVQQQQASAILTSFFKIRRLQKRANSL